MKERMRSAFARREPVVRIPVGVQPACSFTPHTAYGIIFESRIGKAERAYEKNRLEFCRRNSGVYNIEWNLVGCEEAQDCASRSGVRTGCRNGSRCPRSRQILLSLYAGATLQGTRGSLQPTRVH